MSLTWLDELSHVEKIDIDGEFDIFVPSEPKRYANIFSARGRILFNKYDYNGALNAYSMAIVFSYASSFLCKMLCNRAMVYLKLKK